MKKYGVNSISQVQEGDKVEVGVAHEFKNGLWGSYSFSDYMCIHKKDKEVVLVNIDDTDERLIMNDTEDDNGRLLMLFLYRN